MVVSRILNFAHFLLYAGVCQVSQVLQQALSCFMR